MHYRNWGSHLVKFDSYRVTGLWEMVGNRWTHTLTHIHRHWHRHWHTQTHTDTHDTHTHTDSDTHWQWHTHTDTHTLTHMTHTHWHTHTDTHWHTYRVSVLYVNLQSRLRLCKKNHREIPDRWETSEEPELPSGQKNRSLIEDFKSMKYKNITRRHTDNESA